MNGIGACRKCGEPTACLKRVCWWCQDGLERPFFSKVTDIATNRNRFVEFRAWSREAKEEFDPFREARIKAHMERLWGPPLVEVQESGPEAALASGPLQETPMATLSIINNFQLTNSQGMTVSGKQGTFSDGFSTAYEPSTSGLIHYVATTLATATVVTVYDDDNDVPVDFDYLFYISDQDSYIQLVGSATNAIIKCKALHPFVLAGYDSILAAADTTIITGGSEPSVTDIDSVVLGNYSGSTMNYIFAVID